MGYGGRARAALRPLLALTLCLGALLLARPPLTAANVAPVRPPQAASRAADTITVSADAAKPEFPKRITFTLTAHDAAADIVKAQLFYRPVAAAITELAAPDFTPGREVTATAAVDMTEHYLPPGIDIQYYWSLTDAAGNHLDTAPRQFLYQDERFPWRTKQGGQVTVYYYSGNDAFGQDILDTALRAADRLGRSFGVAGDRPIHIVVYGNNRDFASSLPPNSAEWIGGQAHPDLGLIVTGIQPGGGAAAEVRRVIPHEMSHQLLYQATDNPYGGPPHWLDEGLAVYNQETPDSEFGTMLQQAVRDGALIPVRALNSNFPLDPDQALLSYAESLSVVQFIVKTYGDAQLGRLLTSFKNELSYDEALQATLGVDTDGLDRAWKASLGYKGDRAGATLDGSRAPGDGIGRAPHGDPGALASVAAPLAALVVIAAGGLALRRRLT
ncbi:MAG TPA: peptidase MA family metallohydrolase [Thermomicrobiales bacterium]|nr:peptidase MA family metallohydrolase [Thermomicrobiales bacterium]